VAVGDLVRGKRLVDHAQSTDLFGIRRGPIHVSRRTVVTFALRTWRE
jgi:hypothetical protein